MSDRPARAGVHPSWPPRPLLVLLLAGTVLGATGLADHGLWTADEPRVAEIGREMWVGRSFAVPRLNGEAFLEKPPLYWWLQAGIFATFGRATAGLARLASALFAFAALLLTWVLARRWLSPKEALLSGLTLLTTVIFVQRSHWIIVDNALVFATTGALAAFAWSVGPGTGHRRASLALLYAFLAAGFLAKGPVGVAVPVVGILVYLLWSRSFRAWIGWHAAAGAVGVLAVAALWILAVHRSAGPEAVREFLVRNQLGRFAPGSGGYDGGHQRGIAYYLATFPADFLPHTPLLFLAAFGLRGWWSAVDPGRRDAVRFALSASVPVFVLLSFAGTKRGLYLYPIFPPLAVLAGVWLGRAAGGPGLAGKIETGWGWAIVGIACLLGAGSAGVAVHDGSAWVRAIVGPALFLLFAVPILRGIRTVPRPDAWIRRLLLLAAGIASALFVSLPTLDAVKSFEPLAREIGAAVPADEPLVALAPDETTLGVLGFYTGRTVTVAARVEDLSRYAGPGRTAWVVTHGRSGRDEADLAPIRDAGFEYEIVAERLVGDRRMMRLLGVRTPGPAGEPGGPR